MTWFRSSHRLRVPWNVRLRGTNIVPRGATVLWTGWDWDGWIRPQIDDAAKIGNAVRVFGSTQEWLNGHITEATYFARWTQLLDYCASKNLYMIPTGSDLQTTYLGKPLAHTLTAAQAAAHYSTWGALLAKYPGVAGVDLMNEAWLIPAYVDPPPDSYRWMLTVLRGCAAAMHAHGIPVTASFSIYDPNCWSWNLPMFGKYPVAPFMEFDYLDFHIYATSTPAQVAATYQHGWAAGKPMIFGEFGMNGDKPPAARTAFYEMTRQLVTARADNAGALAWTCWDVNAANNQYGLYSAPGVLRPEIAAPFATFPTTRR